MTLTKGPTAVPRLDQPALEATVPTDWQSLIPYRPRCTIGKAQYVLGDVLGDVAKFDKSSQPP